jgi:uncharacterized membrane protein YqhA
MTKILENSKYLVLVGVFTSLLGSIAAFALAVIKLVSIIGKLVQYLDQGKATIIAFIELMDVLLIATALLVFALGLFELFIKEINIPDALTVHSFYDLKTKVGSVVVMVMAITFLKFLENWSNALDILLLAAAIALVSGVLIAQGYFAEKH